MLSAFSTHEKSTHEREIEIREQKLKVEEIRNFHSELQERVSAKCAAIYYSGLSKKITGINCIKIPVPRIWKLPLSSTLSASFDSNLSTCAPLAP